MEDKSYDKIEGMNTLYATRRKSAWSIALCESNNIIMEETVNTPGDIPEDGLIAESRGSSSEITCYADYHWWLLSYCFLARGTSCIYKVFSAGIEYHDC